MPSRLKKALLLALGVLLLAGAAAVQRSLNGDRDRLGLTRVEPLENAPPVLAFTTVALGGFRGLISNALWMRASDLQEEDQFFEMAQLADWITKLEPHYAQVWAHQAWNMAYNISVKFNDPADRWRWVKRGIELLRDEGLRYNPNDVLLFQQLALLFQHKMGANLDDANVYYKEAWAKEMAEVLGPGKPSLEELVHPQTDDAKARARILSEKYKMEPEFMEELDRRYGPLEWRLPEAHAVYWAALGLKRAEEHPEKVEPDDLIMLRRVIFQSMLMSFQRGRLVANPFAGRFEFGPNLDIIPQVNTAYKRAMADDPKHRPQIEIAHRNFLRQAVYGLYLANRLADAAQWYRDLGQEYPDKPLIEGNPNSLPGRLTLEQYAVARVQNMIGDTDRNGVEAILEGYLNTAFESLVLGDDERSAGLRVLTRQLWTSYQSRTRDSQARIGLRPYAEIEQEVLHRLLDPQTGMPVTARAVLRSKMGLGPESPEPPGFTNAPPAQTNTTTSPASGR